MNLRKWAIANRVHPVTAYRWLREGKLPVPATRVGALILIDQPAGGTRTGVTVAVPVCHPLTSANPGVYAEIIIFLDWDNVRESSTGWPCENLGNVGNYKLCHQKDSWGSGWRFFNFELNGQQKNFSGKADVKAILDYVKGKYSGFTDTMWLTRIEVGTEVDDNTQGTAKINNLTFEINGTSKSIELAK